jgi:hypothetical protein
MIYKRRKELKLVVGCVQALKLMLWGRSASQAQATELLKLSSFQDDEKNLATFNLVFSNESQSVRSLKGTHEKLINS